MGGVPSRFGRGAGGAAAGALERTFIIEAIDAVDRRALVVATQKEEIFRVLDFVGEKQAHAFQAVFAPIHVVAASTASPAGSGDRAAHAHSRQVRAGRRCAAGRHALEPLGARASAARSGGAYPRKR